MGIANMADDTRTLIDIQLKKIADIECQMGKDTPPNETEEFKRQIHECLLVIKNIDQEFFEEICPHDEFEI